MDHANEFGQSEGQRLHAIGQEFHEGSVQPHSQRHPACHRDQAHVEDLPHLEHQERCNHEEAGVPSDSAEHLDAQGTRDRVQDQKVPHKLVAGADQPLHLRTDHTARGQGHRKRVQNEEGLHVRQHAAADDDNS